MGVRGYDSIIVLYQARMAILTSHLQKYEESPLKQFFCSAIGSLSEIMEIEQRIYSDRSKRFFQKYHEIIRRTGKCLKTRSAGHWRNLTTVLKIEQALAKGILEVLQKNYHVHEQRIYAAGAHAQATAYFEQTLRDPKIPTQTLVDFLHPEKQIVIRKSDYSPDTVLTLWKEYCRITYGLIENKDISTGWFDAKRLFLDRWISAVVQIKSLYEEGLDAASQFQPTDDPPQKMEIRRMWNTW